MTETKASRMTPCCAGVFQMLENSSSSDDAPTPSMPNVCDWKHAAVDVHWESAVKGTRANACAAKRLLP